jgi:phosphoribosylaminoimidazole (AIR) synthetase
MFFCNSTFSLKMRRAVAMKSEYAQAGVDYTLIQGFKDQMVAVGRQTVNFPLRYQVRVESELPHAHGAVFKYDSNYQPLWVKTQEGLGNLNWIAEWMYQFSGTGRSYYDVIARAAALIIAIDVISHGAMPVVWTDEVAAGDSEWFQDNIRSSDYAKAVTRFAKRLVWLYQLENHRRYGI